VIRARIVEDLFKQRSVFNSTIMRNVVLMSAALSALLMSSCQTRRYAMENVQVPYVVVKQTIMKTMPGGVRSASTNGREMTSGYFSPTNFYEDATERAERAYAKVTILGSSRPFKLDIQTFREMKEVGSRRYINLGQDHDLTKLLARYFKDALADRREERNVIDDFRAF
jgi:hypothetical protein